MAQQVAAGVKGGLVSLNEASGTLTSEAKRYTVGPMLDVRLPFHLGVEVDALYERFGFTGYFNSCCASSITRERDNSWQVPIIAKYRIPLLPLHPYIGVGYAPRVVHGTDVSTGSYLSGITANPPGSVYTTYTNQKSNTNYSVTHGTVVAGGVDLSFGHLRLSPELRYVHWNQPFLNQEGGDGSYRYLSSQNETYVLLGIAWH